jgi:hypothetical protein
MIVFSWGKFHERIVNMIPWEYRDGFVNATPRFRSYYCEDFLKTTLWMGISKGSSGS